MQPISHGKPGDTRNWKRQGTDSPPRASGGNEAPADSLILDFWPSEL